MAGCISSTAYTMQADIYSASVTQGAAGEVIKTWVKEETIDCYARGILRKGVGENSTAFEVNNYVNILNSMVKIRTTKVIPSNKRVVAIRNDYEVVYKEGQDPSSAGGLDGATIFEPRGSTPITNFDGSIIEYETVLMRQEIQRMDVL
jgi:hypothetical protein